MWWPGERSWTIWAARIISTGCWLRRHRTGALNSLLPRPTHKTEYSTPATHQDMLPSLTAHLLLLLISPTAAWLIVMDKISIDSECDRLMMGIEIGGGGGVVAITKVYSRDERAGGGSEGEGRALNNTEWSKSVGIMEKLCQKVKCTAVLQQLELNIIGG